MSIRDLAAWSCTRPAVLKVFGHRHTVPDT
jgi:hypothetical protein